MQEIGRSPTTEVSESESESWYLLSRTSLQGNLFYQAADVSDTRNVRHRKCPRKDESMKWVPDTGSVRHRKCPRDDESMKWVPDTRNVQHRREKTNPWSEYLTREMSNTDEKRRIHEVSTWHGECPTLTGSDQHRNEAIRHMRRESDTGSVRTKKNAVWSDRHMKYSTRGVSRRHRKRWKNNNNRH